MKMFKKRRKGNNKGFSLIELVCALAILGLSTTAISGAMVVSSQSYQRGTLELDVQKEAQTTTNLLGNLVVDAVNVVHDDTANKMTITGKDTTYVVQLDANGTLTYKEGSETPVVLAEGVSYFKVDDDDFATSKNIEIDLAMKRGDKEYRASYNTTARNGQMDPNALAETRIYIENEVTLEPNQEYEFTALVSSSVDFGGLSWTINSGSATFASTSDTGARLKLNNDASGQIAFTVRTNNTKTITDPTTGADITVPLATETVVVNVRRVSSFDAKSHAVISGVANQAGAVYRVYASVTGDNMAKKIGTAYDSNYVSPEYIDFAIASTTGIPVGQIEILSSDVQENCENPYIEFKLKEQLDFNDEIVFTLTSKHSAGATFNGCNKTNANYDIIVQDTYSIKNVSAGPYPNLSGLRRGDNNYYVYCATDIQNEIDAISGNKHAYKYIRYWKNTPGNAPSSDAEGWIPVDTTGSTALKIEKKWSLLMDPRYEYVFEICLVVCRDHNPDGDYSDLAWPTPTTDRAKYISSFVMPASQVSFQRVSASDPAWNDSSFLANLGTKTSPISIQNAVSYDIVVKTERMNITNLKDNYIYTVEKYNAGSNSWEAYSSAEWGRDVMSPDDYGKFTFKDQHAPSGTLLRVKVGVNYPWSYWDDTTQTFDSEGNEAYLPYYNTAEENPVAGCMYFIKQ